MEEAFSQGNMDVVDELIAPDYVHHFPDDPEGGGVRGPEGIKELFGSFRSAFPDLEGIIEEQVAEEDKMVMRYTVRGTPGRASRHSPYGPASDGGGDGHEPQCWGEDGGELGAV
jgi:ketosteroid isomerase-like protein